MKVEWDYIKALGETEGIIHADSTIFKQLARAVTELHEAKAAKKGETKA